MGNCDGLRHWAQAGEDVASPLLPTEVPWTRIEVPSPSDPTTFSIGAVDESV